MVLTNNKEVLKEIIEHADEKLIDLMIALANEYNAPPEYSRQEIEEFHRIREEMLAQPETTYSPEKAFELIRNKRS